MSALNIGLVVVGGLVLVLGLFSGLINSRSVLSDSLIALIVGVVLGPTVLNVLDPASWGRQEVILEAAARVTLAIGLMAIALRLPPGYIRQHWRPLAVLIGIAMPLMWISSALLMYLLLGLPLLAALMIGAIVTPTDPIVASSIVTSETAHQNLPDRVRHTLSAESGLNDGLAFLLVLLPVSLLTRSTDAAMTHWLTTSLIREVGGGIVFGAAIGYGSGRLLRWSEKREYIERASFLAYTVALALLTLGGAKLLGTNDILAVFIAGLTFDDAVGGTERAEEANIQEAVNQFFTLPIFALLGLMLPVDQWLAMGWSGVALALSIMALRRLPAVLVLRPWLRPLHSAQDALYVGWFGPIGVSALFYAMLALRETGDASAWEVSSLIVCASIVMHGMSATPLTKLYGRHSADQDAASFDAVDAQHENS